MDATNIDGAEVLSDSGFVQTFLVVFFAVCLVVWAALFLPYYLLAKKMKLDKAWLIFIPIVNLYFMAKMAKKLAGG